MITTTSGAPFTWHSADFAWADADAGKTWHTAHIARTTLSPAEALTLAPAAARAPHLTEADSFALTDRLARTASLRKHTPLTTRDTLLPRTTVRRTLGETITLTPHHGRQTARTAHTALRLTDDHLQPWHGTLASITFSAAPLTDETWSAASASPSGYLAFHPFEVGEYTYQDALIRLLLTTGAAGTDPLLYDVAFHVDIEDTRENGIAECTIDAPTRVTLTRRFYHPPRIVLTVLAADTDDLLIPRLLGQSVTDGTHTFDCELRKADGTRAEGTVSWMAEGY